MGLNWRKILANTPAERLQKAGYVEEESFKEFVENVLDKGEELKGYYCATCEYAKNGFCTKLEADIASYGCCNYWEFHKHEE